MPYQLQDRCSLRNRIVGSTILLRAPGGASFKTLTFNGANSVILEGDHSLASFDVVNAQGAVTNYPVAGNEIVDWLHELNIRVDPLTNQVVYEILHV